MFLGVAGIITSTHFTLVLLACASFGLGYGAQMPLFNILVATLFGQRSFARMVGIMGPIMLPFNLLGLPMSTWFTSLWQLYARLCVYAGSLCRGDD